MERQNRSWNAILLRPPDHLLAHQTGPHGSSSGWRLSSHSVNVSCAGLVRGDVCQGSDQPLLPSHRALQVVPLYTQRLPEIPKGETINAMHSDCNFFNLVFPRYIFRMWKVNVHDFLGLATAKECLINYHS